MNQYGCEILAAFIVQLKREPTAFLLLCLHNEYCLLLSHCLQSIKHRVKGVCKFTNFRVGRYNGYTFACFPHTHCPDGGEESKEWAKAGAEQHHIDSKAQ